jgi:hypothetical protein
MRGENQSKSRSFCELPQPFHQQHHSAERKQHGKTLTPSQVFLGIISSPHAVHMIQAPAKVRQRFIMEVSEIESNLLSLFGRRPSVRDPEFRIHVIMHTTDAPLPESRARLWSPQWRHHNWTRATSVLHSMLAGT